MSKRKLIGYDLDGVIAPKRENKLLGLLWKINPLFATRIAHKNLPSPIRIPEPNAVIITGRCGANYIDTLVWLAKNGIGNELYLNVANYKPNKQKSMGWKSEKINDLGVTLFYDDDIETVEYLRKNTKAKIVHVK